MRRIQRWAVLPTEIKGICFFFFGIKSTRAKLLLSLQSWLTQEKGINCVGIMKIDILLRILCKNLIVQVQLRLVCMKTH